MVRVSADRDVCIGAGVCVMCSETVFDQDDDGLVVILTDMILTNMILTNEVPEAEQDNVRNAVQLCPSGALRLVD
jgi:ferredoxin